MNELNYKKNSVIFREGDDACNTMYSVRSGSVGIYAHLGTADEKLLTVVEEFGCFGEMGMIEDQPRSAAAVALENSVLYEITEDNFNDYFRDKPSKVMQMMQLTSSRIRALSEDYVKALETITEYVKAEESGEPKPEALLERMRDIVNTGTRRR